MHAKHAERRRRQVMVPQAPAKEPVVVHES
jgi:hypothetical protein